MASERGSIRGTLAHVMEMEWRHISWIDGSLPWQEAQDLRLDGRDIPSVAAAAHDRRRGLVEQMAAAIGSLTEKELSRMRH